MPVIIVKYSGVERLDEEEGRYRAADGSRVLIALQVSWYDFNQPQFVYSAVMALYTVSSR